MKNIFSILEQTPKKDESEVITAQGNAFLTAGTTIKFDCWYDWVYDCRYSIADSFFWSPISKTKFFHSFLERIIKNKCYKKHKNYVFQKAKEGLIMKNIFNKTKKEIIKFVNGNFIKFKVKKKKDKIIYNVNIFTTSPIKSPIKDRLEDRLNKQCIYYYEEEIKQKITKKFPKIKFFFIVDKKNINPTYIDEYEKIVSDYNNYDGKKMLVLLIPSGLERTYILNFYSKNGKKIDTKEYTSCLGIEDVLKRVNKNLNEEDKYIFAFQDNNFLIRMKDITHAYGDYCWVKSDDGNGENIIYDDGFLIKIDNSFLSTPDFGLKKKDLNEFNKLFL